MKMSRRRRAEWWAHWETVSWVWTYNAQAYVTYRRKCILSRRDSKKTGKRGNLALLYTTLKFSDAGAINAEFKFAEQINIPAMPWSLCQWTSGGKSKKSTPYHAYHHISPLNSWCPLVNYSSMYGSHLFYYLYNKYLNEQTHSPSTIVAFYKFILV